MTNDSGLPDYVGDHFAYLVRSNLAVRMAQALFFISGLVLPVMMLLALPDVEGNAILTSPVPLIATGALFAVCLLSYLAWLENRRRRFREEQPASYARWFGWKNRRLGSRDLGGQFGLLKLQIRYVFLGREPSPVETLALTMRLVRNSA